MFSQSSWSLQRHLETLERRRHVALTDDDVIKVAEYAHLSVVRGSAAFASTKADLESTLAAAAYVTEYVQMREAATTTKLSAAAAGVEPPATAATADAFDCGMAMPSQPDAAASRLLDLRRDVPSEGGDAEAILVHAAERDGQFFTVPRAVDA